MEHVSLLTAMTTTKGTTVVSGPFHDRRITAAALLFCSTPRAVVALYYAHCNLDVSFLKQLAEDRGKTNSNDHTLTMIATLLRLGVDLSVRTPDRSALFAAIYGLHIDRASLLHQWGMEVDWCALNTRLLLQEWNANFKQNDQRILLMLACGAPVDFIDCSGRTLFWSAVMIGNLPIMSLLYERGADINRRDRSGDTPFTWLCRRDFMPFLVDAMLNMTGGSGRVALDRYAKGSDGRTGQPPAQTNVWCAMPTS